MLKHMLCIGIFIFQITYVCRCNDPKNYGEFTLILSKILMCKGPKQSECSNCTAKVENGRNMILNMDIKKNVIVSRGKIIILVNGQVVVRLQMKKPCDHLFLRPVFQKLLNVTHECEFQKGTYHLNLDIENMVQKYYGGNFFYGNLTIKSTLYNNECNFFCIVEDVTLSPKKTPKTI